MKVVFASNNAGKMTELHALLPETAIELIPQSALGVNDIEETGATFIENALLKARHACAHTKLPAIADDSGLVVAALNGAPGIYSARYAGEKASSPDNIKKLLHVMKNIPDEKRDAYFYCALVFMQHATDPTPLICEGRWFGKILYAPQGDDGFGYDPIFFVSEENKTAAELTLSLKNKISHRGQALALLQTKMKWEK